MKVFLPIIIIAVIVIGALFVFIPSEKVDEKVENEETAVHLETDTEAESDLTILIEKVNEKLKDTELPMLETTSIDLNDAEMIKSLTGLEDGNRLKSLVISQPLMSSQAYSLVLAKVKNKEDADIVAKEMKEKVDMRRWICVEAEKLYATTSDDIVCLVMTDEETAKKVYEAFKEIVGNVGEEYERTPENIELPGDMY